MKNFSSCDYSKPVKCVRRVLACLLAAGLLLGNVSASAQTAPAHQQGTVTGRVTDASGSPVAGVSIRVQGTTKGATTDGEGRYSVAASSTQALVFTCVGMKQSTQQVGSRTIIDVQMEDASLTIEPIIAVGYGSMRKTDVTGSVASIDAATIQKALPVSIDQALQGRAAGVQMTQNSGIPGGGSSIRIRGVNSINSTNEPIVVIDGVIISTSTGTATDNALSMINPSDIESMVVLKDASAAAIYGAQGANGVILITTKRGRQGVSKVTLDAYWGIQTMPGKLRMLDLPEYAQQQNELYDVRGMQRKDEFADPTKLSKGTDWQDALFHQALMQNYNLSVSGGADKVSYLITGGYLNQDGIAEGSGFRRFNIRGAIDAQAKKWMKVGLTAAPSYSKQSITVTDNDLVAIALRQTPNIPISTPDGSWGGPDDTSFTLSNPVALANMKTNENTKVGVVGNIYADFTPVKGLSLRTEFAYDLGMVSVFQFTPKYKMGAIINNQITNTHNKSFSTNYAWKNVATYDTKICTKHHITAMLGQETTEYKNDYVTGSRNGGTNALHDLGTGDSKTATNDGSTWGPLRTISVFGRLFYSFDERYLLTATLRRDQCSNFPPAHNSDWFPSMALAWRISEEPFMNNVRQINNLKLRFGYGVTGNSNSPLGIWKANLTAVSSIWDLVGQRVANIPNNSLMWEKTDSYNAGIDLGLWGNRIELTFDAYSKMSRNLLLQVSLPAYAGTNGQGAAAAPWANIGQISNKGFDFTINTLNVTSPRGFEWRSSVVFSYNRNKVMSLVGQDDAYYRSLDFSGGATVVTKTAVGRSIGEFFGYQVAGRINNATYLYDNQGVLRAALPQNATVSPSSTWIGDLLFSDIDGNGYIDGLDRVYLGSPLPKFTGGFGNTFSWKGFDLNLYLTFSYGNKVMNWLRRYIDDPRSQSNITKRGSEYARLGLIDPSGSASDPWNVYVSGGNSSMPRMGSADANDNNRVSSRFIEDGSYIRIQNLSLSYNFPTKWVSKMGIYSLKVYCNFQNLYTFTKYSGYDPEVGAAKAQYSNSSQDALLSGIDTGRYPTPRVYTFGVTLGF